MPPQLRKPLNLYDICRRGAGGGDFWDGRLPLDRFVLPTGPWRVGRSLVTCVPILVDPAHWASPVVGMIFLLLRPTGGPATALATTRYTIPRSDRPARSGPVRQDIFFIGEPPSTARVGRDEVGGRWRRDGRCGNIFGRLPFRCHGSFCCGRVLIGLVITRPERSWPGAMQLTLISGAQAFAWSWRA